LSPAMRDIAEAVMPRKIGLFFVTLTWHHCFNGAEAVMPRKIPCLIGCCGLPEWCFNGAEAVMPRKMSSNHDDMLCRWVASMGPRQ